MLGTTWKHFEERCYLLQIEQIKKSDSKVLKDILEGCDVYSTGYNANKDYHIIIYKVYFNSDQELFDWLIENCNFPINFINNRNRHIGVVSASET